MGKKRRHQAAIEFPEGGLEAFCRRWSIKELGVFGSAARGEMRDGSDVDVLVSFEHGVRAGLDEIVSMQIELEDLLGRPVQVVQRDSIRNPYFRRGILHDLIPMYAAG